MKTFESRIFIAMVAIILNINSLYSQDANVFKKVEIKIISTRITEKEQPFIVGGKFVKGELIWNTTIKKPTENNPPGIAFGMIKYEILNKSKEELNVKYTDIVVKINGNQKDIVGQVEIDNVPTFGSGIGFYVKDGEARTEEILFILSNKEINSATIQYGDLPPINLNFNN